jgi:ethanolamine utilization protein EutA
MNQPVQLVGLDFGTTTSSAVVANAQLSRSAATGRMELTQLKESFRSDLVFTPTIEDWLDLEKIADLLDNWLAAGHVRSQDVFGGGALLTGLTAQKHNAPALVDLIRIRLANTLVARADDPCLEAWLAFMGSCATASRAHPDNPLINLDIGGGTTNLALGRAGEVLATGSLFVGARHIRVASGSYRITGLSRFGLALLDHLAIRRGPGDCLNPLEIEAVVDFYVRLLEAAVTGAAGPFADPTAALHRQVALRLPPGTCPAVVTFSGGVGELIYRHWQGEPWPATTFFGDLGIDLARRILRSPLLSGGLSWLRPTAGGRATIFGLLRHSTEVSGSTFYLPQPDILPLADLPILGSLSAHSADEHLDALIDLVKRSPVGGCLQVTLERSDGSALRTLAARITRALKAQEFPADRTLVLLLSENLGKILGHYVTEWGSLPVRLIVIDEIPVRDAQYVHIGLLRDQSLPVSYYGLNDAP